MTADGQVSTRLRELAEGLPAHHGDLEAVVRNGNRRRRRRHLGASLGAVLVVVAAVAAATTPWSPGEQVLFGADSDLPAAADRPWDTGPVHGAGGGHVWWLTTSVPGEPAERIVIDLTVEGLHQAEVRLTLHGSTTAADEVDPRFWWRERTPGLGIVYGYAPQGTREVTATLRSGDEVTGTTRFVGSLDTTVFALPVPVQEPGWESLGVVEVTTHDAQGAITGRWTIEDGS